MWPAGPLQPAAPLTGEEQPLHRPHPGVSAQAASPPGSYRP